MTAIEVKNLSKRFGRTQALAGVDLKISEGEMVALIGASGSGKSTLLRHIAALESSDGDGGVEIFGQSLNDSRLFGSSAREIRREIGVIFQQFNLVSRLPVITNVLTGNLGRIPGWRGTLGLFNAEEKRLARAALARVGIPNVVWQRASTLSGGQQQRAAIARSLVQKSRILLADEPIASLDPSSARRVMDVLAEINREDGITVVVSLHQVEYARLYCPRTVALRDGKIVFDGPSRELSREILTDLYGAHSEELVLPDSLPVKSPPQVPSDHPGQMPAFATA